MNNKLKYIIGIIIFICIVLFGGIEFFDEEFYIEENIEESSALINTNEILKEDLKIYFIEKTTTNMIQKINPIFAVNPLISKEI